MVDLDSAVLIKKDERARLIEMSGGEGNAELHRSDRDPALFVRLTRVPIPQLRAPGSEIARLSQLAPDALQPVVFNFLPVGRGVGFPTLAVKVALPNEFGSEAGGARHAIDNFLDHQHSLRTAETAESRVRCKVGLGNTPAEFEMRYEVSVVEVKNGAIGHRAREIE